MNEKTANQITRYSFVLTVFVIWMHAGEALISSIPGQIAVPGFFILSGFLFFLSPVKKEEGAGGTEEDPEASSAAEKTGKPGWRELLFPDWLEEKLERRVRTLLIPYLLWNLIYYLIYLISGRAELRELPAAVLHYSCNPVFWYLFQLILIMCLTPLLNPVLKEKQTAVCWLAAVLACAVFYHEIHTLIGVDLINADALFYFSLGGFTARHRICSRETGRKQNMIRLIFCCGAMFLFLFLQPYLPVSVWNLCEIGVRVSGAFGCWFLTGLFPQMPVRPWMKITFFIYATHYCVIRAVWALETAAGLNENRYANIIVYLLMPAVCTAAAWALYLLMKKYTPKLLCLLTGGRG